MNNHYYFVRRIKIVFQNKNTYLKKWYEVIVPRYYVGVDIPI